MARGVTAFRTAQLEQAEMHFRRAVREGQFLDAEQLLPALVSLSEVRRTRGDFVEAEALVLRGISIVDRIPGVVRGEKATLLNNLAALYELQGRMSDAEALYLQALQIREKDAKGSVEERLSLLGNMATFYAKAADNESAATYFARAESLLGSIPSDSETRIAVLNNRGVFEEQAGLGDNSLSMFEQAANGLAKSTPRPSLASSLHNLGTALLRRGRTEEAAIRLRASAEIRRKLLGAQHPDLAATLFGLAEVAEVQGKPGEALALAREASGIVRRRLETALPGRESAGEIRAWRTGFMTHLRLLATAGPAASRDATEAFELAQLAKYTDTARTVASMAARFATGTGDIAKLIRDRQETESRRRLLEAEIARQIALGDRQRDSAVERQIRRELDEIHRQLELTGKEINSRFPTLLDLTSGRPRSHQEIAALLSDDEVLILFVFGEREGIRIEATRNSVSLHRVPIDTPALDRSVRALRRALDLSTTTGASIPRFPLAEAHRLYGILFGGSSAPSKPSWLVVADSALESLPLSVLLVASPLDEDSYDRQPWLIRNQRIAYLPGVSAFHALRRLAPREFGAGLFAGFANPVLGEGEVPQRSVVGTGKLQNRRTLADPVLLRQQAALPDTADEVKAIALELGGGDLILGAEATERRVRAMDLSKYRYLMFATHGLVAGDHPGIPEPGLVLTPPPSASPEDDGVLTAAEVSQLRLNADLVVLSACNTAATDGTLGAEGFSGLAKAFFHAGSRALLVSHWPVVSESTVLITIGTFRALRSTPGRGKSEALRNSMLAILDNPNQRQFHHPLFWAPFVIVGDGR